MEISRTGKPRRSFVGWSNDKTTSASSTWLLCSSNVGRRHETVARTAIGRRTMSEVRINRLFARQSFALAPAFWRDKFSTPQAALLFSRDGLPRFHSLMVRESPTVAHHFNLQVRFLDETIHAKFIALLPKNETSHSLIANHLAEELGRFFAARVERTANQALLIQLRRVHAAIEFRLRSIVEDQCVRV